MFQSSHPSLANGGVKVSGDSGTRRVIAPCIFASECRAVLDGSIIKATQSLRFHWGPSHRQWVALSKWSLLFAGVLGDRASCYTEDPIVEKTKKEGGIHHLFASRSKCVLIVPIKLRGFIPFLYRIIPKIGRNTLKWSCLALKKV